MYKRQVLYSLRWDVQATDGDRAMSSLLSEMQVEYLVREDGERTGVILNWQDFQKLRARLEADPDLLVGLDVETLSALSLIHI